MYFLISLFSIISCGKTQPTSTCPEIQPLSQPFNFTAFVQGGWYELARYNDYFESTNDCTYLSFNITDKVVNTHSDYVEQNQARFYDGSMDSRDGVLLYSSNVIKGGTIPLQILDFDPNSHIVIYNCTFDEDSKTKKDMAWILSRTKTLDDETKTVIGDMFHKNNIIDKSKFYWEDFTNKACKS